MFFHLSGSGWVAVRGGGTPGGGVRRKKSGAVLCGEAQQMNRAWKKKEKNAAEKKGDMLIICFGAKWGAKKVKLIVQTPLGRRR